MGACCTLNRCWWPHGSSLRVRCVFLGEPSPTKAEMRVAEAAAAGLGCDGSSATRPDLCSPTSWATVHPEAAPAGTRPVACDGSSATPSARAGRTTISAMSAPVQGTGGDPHSRVKGRRCRHRIQLFRTVGIRATSHISDGKVIRITEAGVFRACRGQKDVQRILDRFACAPTLIWVSFPCTSGSAWQEINWRPGKPETKSRICAHWSVLRDMWQSFTQVVLPHAHRTTIHIAWEWPSICA